MQDGQPYMVTATSRSDVADDAFDFSVLDGDRLQVDIAGTAVTSLGDLAGSLSTDGAGNLLVGLGDWFLDGV
jgi:hypothetical protein